MSASSERLQHLRELYEMIADLEQAVGGNRLLSQCNSKTGWPGRGVYFFFEDGEVRSDSGDGPRVVRVGTHALTATSKTSLWNRLSQHRGSVNTGGGNHRGSVFRLIVGSAMLARDSNADLPTWGKEDSAGAEILRPVEESSRDLVERFIAPLIS